MKNNLFQEFNSLPPVLQDAILSDATYANIRDAINLANIDPLKSEEYFEKISDLISDILFLKQSFHNFPNMLQQLCPELPEPKRNIIITVIQQKIFEPLKDELNSIPEYKELTKKLSELKESLTPIEQTNDKKPILFSNKTPKPNNSDTEFKSTKQDKELSNQNKEPLSPVIPETPSLTNINPENQSRPELTEIPAITIQRPLTPTNNLKKIEIPNVSQEEQEKIRNRLLQAITKKEDQHKIVDTIKEVIKQGVKTTLTPRKKQPSVIISKEETSEVISSNQITNPKTSNVSSKDLFGIKIKEVSSEEHTTPLPKTAEPIKYEHKKEASPFGEA